VGDLGEVGGGKWRAELLGGASMAIGQKQARWNSQDSHAGSLRRGHGDVATPEESNSRVGCDARARG
jgi:hypothetical protein